MRKPNLCLPAIPFLLFFLFLLLNACQTVKEVTAQDICGEPIYVGATDTSYCEVKLMEFYEGGEKLEKRIDSIQFQLKVYEAHPNFIENHYLAYVQFLILNYQHYSNQGKAKKALSLLEKAEANLKRHAQTDCDYLALTRVYSNMGMLYTEIKNHDLSINYLQKALQINRRFGRVRAVARNLANLSLPYLGNETFENALDVSSRAVCIWKNSGIRKDNPDDKDAFLSAKINLAVAQVELAKRFALKGEKAKAKRLFDSSLLGLQSVLDDLKADAILGDKKLMIKISTMLNIGMNYINREDIPKPPLDLSHFDELLSYLPHFPIQQQYNKLKNQINRTVAVLQAKQGDCQAAKLSMSNAVKAIALLSSSDSINLANAYVHHKADIVATYRSKAITEKYCFEHTKDLVYLTSALATYQELLDYMEAVRTGLTTDQTKENAVRNIDLIYHRASAIAIQLFKQTEQAKYLATAFQISDRSKSLTLREELYEKLQAKQLSATDLEWFFIKKEKHFQATINRLENKLIEATNTKNKKGIQLYQDSLINQKSDYQSFINQLASGNSREQAYFYSKATNNIPSFKKIQQDWLNHETAIIEYEIGPSDKGSFAIVITKTDEQLVPINVDSAFFSLVDVFATSLQQNKIDFFANESYQLYQKVVAPVINALSQKGIRNLVIIPDGKLNQVSFAALLTRAVKKGKKFKTHPYLIKDYTISYLPSLSVYQSLSQLNKTDNTSIPFAGFIANPTNTHKKNQATTATKITPKNPTLKGTAIPKISATTRLVKEKYFNKNGLIFEQSTTQLFKEEAPKAAILQLSLHGYLAKEKGVSQSHLSFYPSNTDNGQLTLSDLYSMELNAQTVFLANCNSGQGDLNDIEGLKSIARAFFYAGCQGTIATLDYVGDAQTATITQDFYKHLIEHSLTASEALAKAQRNYFLQAKNHKKAHPRNWSHYKYSGVAALGNGVQVSNSADE